MASGEDKSSKAWAEILNGNEKLCREIEENGLGFITADEIKKYREPRLMTKHDNRDWVPTPLADRGWNILSVSRSGYALGDFNVFENFPVPTTSRAEFCEFPEFETLAVDNISSESNAINAMIIAGILESFLGTEPLTETFNGRMGAGCFSFSIGNGTGTKTLSVNVQNAQLEIDGGFESDDAVVIVEAKNRIFNEFNIRQLYYPYRRYEALVKKPIRLVFSQYTNLKYNLFEYEFVDRDDFSSIVLKRQRSFTFEDDRITSDDIREIWRKTRVRTDDDQLGKAKSEKIPFPQANKIERVIGLMEFLSNYPEGVQTDEIAEYMGVVTRQANYYPAAGRYLGFMEKPEQNLTKLSTRGRQLLKKNRRLRLLGVVEAVFEHEIFHTLYGEAVIKGELPTKQRVIEIMDRLNVLGKTTQGMLERRSSSVSRWLRWLFLELPEDED